MAKKKAEPSKSKTARQKKLRLVDHSPIGLTDAEQHELCDLYRPLAHLSGSALGSSRAINYKRIAFERLLYIYIEALCCDARAENVSQRRGQTTSLRRKIVTEIGKLRGRDFSPDDIINALAKHAPVPKYAVSAIRRDYLRVTV
jgi:hypothetical protein